MGVIYMAAIFNRPRLQDFLTFYFEDWPNIEKAQHKILGITKKSPGDKVSTRAQKE